VTSLLNSLGVKTTPGKNIGLYGLSLVGKSVLASMLCSEFCGEEGTAIVFGVEEHFADEEYRSLITQFLPRKHYINYCPNLESIYKYFSLVERKEFEGRLCLILDSLSFVAIRESATWQMRGVTEPRIIASRVIPALYTVAGIFKHLVVEKNALGIVVMHAGSTAGTQKYRGLTDLRPSMASRVAHSLDYLILMESEGPTLESPRKLTLVASRLTPLNEGKTVRFVFKGRGVELIKEGG